MLLWSLENLTVQYFFCLKSLKISLVPSIIRSVPEKSLFPWNKWSCSLFNKKTLAGPHVDNGTSIANRILRAHAVRVKTHYSAILGYLGWSFCQKETRWMKENCRNSSSLIGLFSLSITTQTHWFIIYAMRQQAKADSLTILKCLRIHSYFENIMTKFVIDNSTDAYVNLLILFSRFCHSFFYLLKGTNFRDKNNFFGPSFDPQFVVEGRPGLPFPFIGFTAEHKTRPLMLSHLLWPNLMAINS